MRVRGLNDYDEHSLSEALPVLESLKIQRNWGDRFQRQLVIVLVIL